MTTTIGTAKMRRAFDLVCPRAHALKLAEQGLIPREVAEQVSWKGAIGALVTEAELRAADVTIADVADAVDFFTATTARVSAERIATEGGGEQPGYLVIAAGYYAGPAN